MCSLPTLVRRSRGLKPRPKGSMFARCPHTKAGDGCRFAPQSNSDVVTTRVSNHSSTLLLLVTPRRFHSPSQAWLSRIERKCVIGAAFRSRRIRGVVMYCSAMPFLVVWRSLAVVRSDVLIGDGIALVVDRFKPNGVSSRFWRTRRLLLVLSEVMVSAKASLLVGTLPRVFAHARNDQLRCLPLAAAEMRVCWVVNTTIARSRVMSVVSVEVLKSVLCDVVVSAKKWLLRRHKLAAGDGQSRWIGAMSRPRSATLQPTTAMQCNLHEIVRHAHITMWALLLPFTMPAKDVYRTAGLDLPKSSQTSPCQDSRRCRPSTLPPQQHTTQRSGRLSKTWSLFS
jgi:hypothetical protein